MKRGTTALRILIQIAIRLEKKNAAVKESPAIDSQKGADILRQKY
ncbi:hypothetical protein SAMN04515679_4139 [Pelosinus fermentans]|uniref:Uncharacterized protein n=1 Tax=Pelosinus fermentans B4 TaxID=1149862 RepID=I9B2Y8_9FIRM|nr:hypothetical protein FB4_2680 [Pelosinus fermentans B4]EIW24770.1 hypothetical protein FA11_3161 [Pelosinus fermentans A11]OAM95949.1 hypothetical protein FR7_03971 [Pelosinus fermentans DSM 17108]SDR34653.1 hypothetical protein SAMN04515679_4139 [Pelosinus fermentans]